MVSRVAMEHGCLSVLLHNDIAIILMENESVTSTLTERKREMG